METREFVKEILKFEPEKTAFWYFQRSTNIFGDSNYPGRCNGNLVRNLLHYYSKEGNVIVDPMAGGGTTIDVCNLMDRKGQGWDIKPHKDYPEIKKHDIRQGYPK